MGEEAGGEGCTVERTAVPDLGQGGDALGECRLAALVSDTQGNIECLAQVQVGRQVQTARDSVIQERCLRRSHATK